MESHSTPRKFLNLKMKMRSSFVPPTHRNFDATRYLDKTRYFIFRVNSFPILFKSSSKTLGIGSKSSQLPQNYSRFRPFPELWARRASDKLTNAQSCRKLRTSHLHWQWFCSCEEKRKNRSEDCISLCNSLVYWKSGKQNHNSKSTAEAEFNALLEGITEVEFLQDVIHFAYKVDKRILNCKNTPIFS